MSKIGDFTVRVCNSLNSLPSLLLCFLLVLIQSCTVNYYLIHHLTIYHLIWLLGDVLVVVLFIICFRFKLSFHSTLRQHRTHTIVWVTWLVMQLLLAAKIVVICTQFSTELEDEDATFFGPNTLKTAIALGSCIFVLLLTSQHDTTLASPQRRYIEELTGTVVFDILDTADILEILFDEKDRPEIPSGFPELILAVATFNLLLPTVPLVTLSKTKFGLEKLRKRLIYLHRLLVILAVNVPNLFVRMMLWHIYSVAISPFTLKNIILICMTLYEFYEHKIEKIEEHEKGAIELEEGKTNEGNQPQMKEEQISKSKGQWDRVKGETNKDDDIHFGMEDRVVTEL